MKFFFALAAVLTANAGLAQTPIKLTVDLTDAPRRILHATETMPVQPGPMTLVYPKWIPGEHGPTGPIDNSGRAGDCSCRNRRAGEVGARCDGHVRLPPHGACGCDAARHQDGLPRGSGGQVLGGWLNQREPRAAELEHSVLYPAGKGAADVMVTPSLSYPAGWKFGTALDSAGSPTAGNGAADGQLQDRVAGTA